MGVRRPGWVFWTAFAMFVGVALYGIVAGAIRITMQGCAVY